MHSALDMIELHNNALTLEKEEKQETKKGGKVKRMAETWCRARDLYSEDAKIMNWDFLRFENNEP